MSEKRSGSALTPQPPLPILGEGKSRSDGGEGFIPTELGDLPVEWEVVRLGEVAKTKSGGTPSRKNLAYFNGSIPWIKSGELNDGLILSANEYISDDGLSNSSAKLFPPNTLLIALYGATVGKTGLLQIEAATNQAVCAIFPENNSFFNEFMMYCMMHRREGLLRERYGGAQPNISQRTLRNFLIPVPPLDEQRRIAHVLNTVQQAIAAQEDVIAAAQEVKRSLLRRLFTVGPGPEPAPTRETAIGEVPAHWQVVELQEVADIIYGIQAAVAHMTDSTVGIPILTNINMTLEGTLDFSTLRYYELSEKQYDKRLQKGDVLFNWRSGSPHHVGKTAIFDMDGDYTFSSFILRFRARNEMSNVCLAHYLHWLKGRGFFMQKRQQSSVNSVFNKSAASKIPTLLPPLDEQRRIAHILQAADAKIAAEQDRLAALREVLGSLLQDLMSGRRRVEQLTMSKR